MPAYKPGWVHQDICRRLEKFVRFDRSLMRARFDAWKRILRIGLPPGGEFALMFVYMVAIYWVIRPFGAEAQAGFGIGQRVMQAIFLPAMAIAFAVAPSPSPAAGTSTATTWAPSLASRLSRLRRRALCMANRVPTSSLNE